MFDQIKAHCTLIQFLILPSDVTAPICMAEKAIVTLNVCEIRRHEIGWLTAACFWLFFCYFFLRIRIIFDVDLSVYGL